MKNLLSILTARPLNLLFPAALVAGFLAPSQALASRAILMGGDDTGGSEGDPLDTNDFDGGGGGGDVYIQPNYGAPGSRDYLGLDISRFSVLMVPEIQGGTLIFRIIFLDSAALGPDSLSLEGNHAP